MKLQMVLLRTFSTGFDYRDIFTYSPRLHPRTTTGIIQEIVGTLNLSREFSAIPPRRTPHKSLPKFNINSSKNISGMLFLSPRPPVYRAICLQYIKYPTFPHLFSTFRQAAIRKLIVCGFPSRGSLNTTFVESRSRNAIEATRRLSCFASDYLDTGVA